VYNEDTIATEPAFSTEAPKAVEGVMLLLLNATQ
jgi:hypothetical protein